MLNMTNKKTDDRQFPLAATGLRLGWALFARHPIGSLPDLHRMIILNHSSFSATFSALIFAVNSAFAFALIAALVIVSNVTDSINSSIFCAISTFAPNRCDTASYRALFATNRPNTATHSFLVISVSTNCIRFVTKLFTSRIRIRRVSFIVFLATFSSDIFITGGVFAPKYKYTPIVYSMFVILF